MNTATLNKISMWYKVNDLFPRFNKSQIAKILNLHRDTVRRYLSMDLEEFVSSGICKREYKKKLQVYEDSIRKKLGVFPFLSSAKIHDYLKEEFPNLPEVSDRTVYNFVEYIRTTHNISKRAEPLPRQTEQGLLSEYGQDAQVDFGEKRMLNEHSQYVRVYFFVIVLCRSRHKFVYHQTTPFTSSSAIYAHYLAFEYFGNLRPHRILYDQDKVLLKSENLGDLLMTSEFSSFVKQAGFETVFCRKSDPQSKGKVENVVKYVKHNFLSGRFYKGIDTLNHEAIGWLARTANGKKHAATRLIPSDEFKIESTYMVPFHGSVEKPSDQPRSYTVRKDNTIAYRGCFYSLPLGSYKFSGCKVLVAIKEHLLQIYEESTGKMIASHEISPIKGVLVQNTNHRRNTSSSLKEMQSKALILFNNDTKAALYLQLLHRDKPRYFRDNLQAILKHLPQYPLSIRQEALVKCLDAQAYNANIMIEISNTILKKQQCERTIIPITDYEQSTDLSSYDMLVEKSNIDTYSKAMM